MKSRITNCAFTAAASSTTTVMVVLRWCAAPPIMANVSSVALRTSVARAVSHAHDATITAVSNAHTNVSGWRRSASPGSPHQLEQREQDEPDDVDHVPVRCAGFHERDSGFCWSTQVADDEAKDHQPEEHVAQVHSCHHEVVHEEQVGLRVHAGGHLRDVFEQLEKRKGCAAGQCDAEQPQCIRGLSG